MLGVIPARVVVISASRAACTQGKCFLTLLTWANLVDAVGGLKLIVCIILTEKELAGIHRNVLVLRTPLLVGLFCSEV